MKTKEKKSKNKSNENFSKFILLFGYPRTRLSIGKIIHSAISGNCYARQKQIIRKQTSSQQKIYTMTDGSPVSKLTGCKWRRSRPQRRIVIWTAYTVPANPSLELQITMETYLRSRVISWIQTLASVTHHLKVQEYTFDLKTRQSKVWNVIQWIEIQDL